MKLTASNAFARCSRVLTCAVPLILGACTTTVAGGSGDAGDGAPAIDGAPGSTPAKGGAATPAATAPVPGRAFYSTADGSVLVDLATQESERISQSDLWPTLDGTLWAGYLTTRRYSADEDDVVIYDSTWKRQQTIPIRRSLHGGVQLSPDKQSLTAFWADEESGESFTDSTLTLFDRAMKPLARLPNATAHDWMPDGRLVYAEQGGIFIADALGGGARRIAQVDGAPRDIAVSRDGSRLAISIGPSLAESHVWTLNADGTGLAQLTQSGHNEINPVWTGDGRLLVRYYVSTSAEGYNGCPDLFVIASTSPTPFDPSKSPSFASKIMYREPKSTTPRSACPFSRVAWLP